MEKQREKAAKRLERRRLASVHGPEDAAAEGPETAPPDEPAPQIVIDK